MEQPDSATSSPGASTNDDVTAEAGGSAGRWLLDSAKSSVTMHQKTLWGLVTVRGAFSEIAGEGVVGPVGSVRGTLTIGAASLDTKLTKRDEHLRSSDFFDAANHPEITYTATAAELDRHPTVVVHGTLEISGVSRPLTITATVTDTSTGRLTLETEIEVDRSEFGMTWNKLGMMRGPTTASVVACFTRQDGERAELPPA